MLVALLSLGEPAGKTRYRSIPMGHPSANPPREWEGHAWDILYLLLPGQPLVMRIMPECFVRPHRPAEYRIRHPV